MDIRIALEQLAREGRYAQLAVNPAAQFGRPARRYLGATLLPEQTVPENAYRKNDQPFRMLFAPGELKLSGS
ncbi:MAG: hypothetical protein EI684_22105 [Candidatus Viridilinea halotolerans]|uniref:Uncharacterized protein n=1 Tax=Candidatus Viridilinea halotolerans TaxID=2491704 RepID=A0A426TQZ8_9CHLR|nr:MAG: hypothetical protein EI684_22105 [Candidatus Viridilinea halotolerans]